MSTSESPMVAQLWQRIHSFEPAAKFGGSVPNLATELRHSYHRSWNDSPHDGGYSVHWYWDRHCIRSCRGYAAALDVTFDDPKLMARYTGRLVNWVRSGKRYPSLYGLREFAGTLDGKTVTAYDCTPSKPFRTYGWDDSHLWHIHLSISRSALMNKRILSLADVFRP